MRRRELLRGLTVGAGTVAIPITEEVTAQAAPGSEQWRFETRNWVESSPTVADGTVYVGSFDNNLYAVDAQSGTEQWRFDTGDRVSSSPTVADGTVYVGSVDTNLYAVNIANSDASSEGSRVLLGTLGHTDQFDPDAPAADSSFTATPTPTATSEPTATPTPTPTPASTPTSTPTIGSSVESNDFMWILLGLLGVGGVSAYYWLSDNSSQQTDHPSVSSSDSTRSDTNSSSDWQTQQQSLPVGELWETYHGLKNRDPESPQQNPTAVENHLDTVQQLLPERTDDSPGRREQSEGNDNGDGNIDNNAESGTDTRSDGTDQAQSLPKKDFVEAREHLDEAQRLAGPTVEYLLTQGRQLVTDARDTQADGDIDAAVRLWEDATSQYERARERAAELDDSRESEIADTYSTVTARLSDARQRQIKTDIRQASTSAWDAVTTGDDRVHTDGEITRAKTAYTVAAEEYQTVRDHLQEIDTEMIDTDSVETAIAIAQDARSDCESIDMLRRTQSGLTEPGDGEETASLETLTSILDELHSVSRKNEFLHKQVLTALVWLQLKPIRGNLQQVREYFTETKYQEAGSALDDAETRMIAAADTVEDAPASMSTEPRSAVDTMQRQLNIYREAITETLTNIDADPTLEPVTDIPLTRPGVSDLPAESDVCQVIPARLTLWQAVAPELQSEYDALQSLLTTVQDSECFRWLSSEHDERITSHQTTLDDIEPLTASETLRSRREEVLSDCRSVVTALNQRVTTDLKTLEDANLPEEFVASHEEIGQIDTDSLREIDDIEQFTQEWSKSVSQLINKLNAINDTVSVVEAYDEIADMIDERLATNRTVSSEELPVNFAEQVLRIYAHRRSDITFDPDQSLIYLNS